MRRVPRGRVTGGRGHLGLLLLLSRQLRVVRRSPPEGDGGGAAGWRTGNHWGLSLLRRKGICYTTMQNGSSLDKRHALTALANVAAHAAAAGFLVATAML
jgi:hypothetical protein